MNTKYVGMVMAMAIILFPGVVVSYTQEVGDDVIEVAIKDSYTFKTYLKDDDIAVDSENGIVTLTGTVSEEYHKLLAVDTVSNLPGVKSVQDKLKVTEEDMPEYSDSWLSMKAKSVLLFHRNLNPRTQVYVDDGVVTLQGTATSQAQKDLTTEYIKDVEGVKEVKNEMVVQEAAKKPQRTLNEKIDDASITAQVKWALLVHRSTSALATNVSTQKGVVTLTGSAENSAAKELVTKIVSDIKGVKRVINNMDVK